MTSNPTKQARRNLVTTRPRQRGMALIFVMLMMGMVFSIAAISARIGTQGERMARADRDRQVALQGAESALIDAEMDIMDPRAGSRACSMLDSAAEPGCSFDSELRGICSPDLATPDKPTYKVVDFSETDNDKRRYVIYGEFTNRQAGFAVSANQTGGVSGNAIPVELPRYIIEKVALSGVMGKTSDGTVLPVNLRKDAGSYRVIAVGYGYSKSTQVMLEATIFAPVIANKCTGGGL